MKWAELMGPASDPRPEFSIEVFYDGECPLCSREIRTLKRFDRHGRIRATDITASGFESSSVGVPWSDLMDRIHGRLPDGTLIEGVEVFRRLYAAAGFGPLMAATRLPGISQALDFAYDKFAKQRLKLTGRCEGDVCQVPRANPESAANRAS